MTPPERWWWPEENRHLWQPLKADHPAVRKGEKCALCGSPMVAGNMPTLITIGPASAEDAEKAASGHAYTAEALIAHWECASAAVSSFERGDRS